MGLFGFPLLLIPFAIYNIVAFLMPGVSWSAPILHVNLASGGEWTMSPGEMLVALATLMLFFETLKATRVGIRTVVDHALSLLLFVGMLIEFILVRQAASSTFFLLLVVSIIDVLGGFAVTLRSAQRDVTIDPTQISPGG
ncbi:MAG: hypothetical protein JOZ70_04180 [Pseudolabrys sp.]|nr:hypothetical protein [Pseudolabrys sp.]MBV9954430.1 hypothetical protein [Pseudolabrys sp.]